MSKVEVCLTPELIHQFDLHDKLVVAVDIFRATSCMVTGLGSGVQAIHPVLTIEECLHLGQQGMITAGERGGKKIEEFDLGNSPFEYMQEHLKGRSIAVTTTNGTNTIKKSLAAKQVLIGSFLNLSATVDYILSKKQDVIVHCAGWKGSVNLEDTLFAGALIHRLDFQLHDDSSQLAHKLYLGNSANLLSVAQQSGHARRLAKFGITKDIAYCLQTDKFDIVCGLEGTGIKIVS